MHSLNKQLLNTYFVPGTVLVTGDKAMDKTDQNSPSDGTCILAGTIPHLSSLQLFTTTGKPLDSNATQGIISKVWKCLWLSH